MWGGGGGAAPGPKAATGTYTVKVTSGAWSQSQTFELATDPRLPAMTEAESAEQLKLALQIGAQVRQLYDTLAQFRSAKALAMEIAKKTESLGAASKTLVDRIVAVEGEITQLQGEGGQDALNFPGRIDNQWVVLYQNVVSMERKLNRSVLERYADLKPPTDQLMQRAAAVLKADMAAFNAAAAKAGITPGIVVK